jgi:uncharacterized Zn finger protein
MNTKKSTVTVASAVCPVCSKENVHKRVPAFHRDFSSTLKIRITCKACGHLFFVPENKLDIHSKLIEEINDEYGGVAVLYDMN